MEITRIRHRKSTRQFLILKLLIFIGWQRVKTIWIWKYYRAMRLLTYGNVEFLGKKLHYCSLTESRRRGLM